MQAETEERWGSAPESGGKAASGAAPAIDLVSELDKLLELVERARRMTNRYDASLDTIAGRLTPEIEPNEVRIAIERLKESTRQMITDNETLNADLERTRRQAQDMRVNLTIARREAVTDALTSLHNRRYFDSAAETLFADAQSRKSGLAAIMLDVDHFKRFNSEHGHQIGDQVLRLVAGALREHIPQSATTARYGGEEFIAFLPGADLKRALKLAEQVRASVSGKDLVKRQTAEKLGRVTISLGVAAARPSDTVASLIERADRCLSGAKTLGRDRAVGEHELPIHAPPVRKAS